MYFTDLPVYRHLVYYTVACQANPIFGFCIYGGNSLSDSCNIPEGADGGVPIILHFLAKSYVILNISAGSYFILNGHRHPHTWTNTRASTHGPLQDLAMCSCDVPSLNNNNGTHVLNNTVVFCRTLAKNKIEEIRDYAFQNMTNLAVL